MVEQTNSSIETAEAEQATFSMLAAFYNTNPEAQFLRTISALNPLEIEDPEIRSLVERIINSANGAEPLLELKRDWTKLFRGVSPDYGPVPPYAQQYINDRKLDIVNELAAIYNKYGYTSHIVIANRHDYIGCLLDFAAHISAMHVSAIKSGSIAEQAELFNLLTNFIAKYINYWFGQFCKEAAEHSSTEFYRSVLTLTQLITLCQ